MSQTEHVVTGECFACIQGREDFPPRRPGQLGWVLHAGATTVRIADLPNTDWPGTITFLASYGNRGWEFCAHEPHC